MGCLLRSHRSGLSNAIAGLFALTGLLDPAYHSHRRRFVSAILEGQGAGTLGELQGKFRLNCINLWDIWRDAGAGQYSVRCRTFLLPPAGALITFHRGGVPPVDCGTCIIHQSQAAAYEGVLEHTPDILCTLLSILSAWVRNVGRCELSDKMVGASSNSSTTSPSV